MGRLDKAASRQGGGSDMATVEIGDRDPTKGEEKKKCIKEKEWEREEVKTRERSNVLSRASFSPT
jgi:hypothetical protein